MILIHENFDLTRHNSFGIEARARKLIEFGTGEELSLFLSNNADILKNQWDILGGGNNILFTRDYDGVLLHPVSGTIQIVSENDDYVRIRVLAGCDWDSLVAWSVDNNLWGLENLSRIPSYVGSAPVQNIGAYGTEAKETIKSVEILHTGTLKISTLSADHCGFGYRDSIFKRELKGKAIITAVNFRLSRRPLPNISYGALKEEVEKLGEVTLQNIRKAVINIRESKLPDPAQIGNAGSFFKNPVVCASHAAALKEQYPDMPQYPDTSSGNVKLAAGWLIDKTGWRGKRIGNAGVYEKQALIIVNHGGASGAEILEFSRKVQNAVREMFGIGIEAEVNIF